MRVPPRFPPRRAIGLLLLILTLGAKAHQPGLSTVLIELGTNQLTARIILAWQELEPLVPMDADRDGMLKEAELAAARARLGRVTESALEIVSDGRMLAQRRPPAIDLEDATGLRLLLTYEFPPTGVLTLTSELITELAPNHKQIVTLRDTDHTELHTTVLERSRPAADFPLAALRSKPAGRSSGIRDFLWLGLEHIALGWDHLAFLFGLLAIGGTLRDAIKIITSFTAAHSLTLALATLNLIRIPSSVVEPVIAASIVYVGIENLFREDFSKRWMLTFAFGLIHGCGFATALRDLGVGADGASVVTPLVCFNLGVELGQLALAGMALPLIWKLKPLFPRRWILATSVGLIAVGNWFLAQRLLS